MQKNKLIIFVKNAEAGKVKTRLAASVGNEEALEIYQKLLAYTFEQTHNLDVSKEVWYSRFIPENDIWANGDFKTEIQSGENLGKRISNAFQQSFKIEGVEKVVIIGSDCAELTSEIIQQSFEKLEETDFVIGPAKDGGYYLLGMNAFTPKIFEDINWSTPSVFKQTISKINELEGTYSLLQQLSDVDIIEDWKLVKNTRGL